MLTARVRSVLTVPPRTQAQGVTGAAVSDRWLRSGVWCALPAVQARFRDDCRPLGNPGTAARAGCHGLSSGSAGSVSVADRQDDGGGVGGVVVDVLVRPVTGAAGPGRFWNACGTAKPACCDSSPTPPSPRQATRPNATCGRPKPSRKSPAGSARRKPPTTGTPSADTPPLPPSTGSPVRTVKGRPFWPESGPPSFRLAGHR